MNNAPENFNAFCPWPRGTVTVDHRPVEFRSAGKSADYDPSRWRWIVALTEPQREGTVWGRLSALEFDAYLPMMPHWRNRRCGGGRKLGECPMFPGYLFISLEIGNEPWRILSQVPGLRGYLQVGGKLAVIPQLAVDVIRKKQFELSGKDPNAALIAAQALKIGDGRRVVDGPFASFSGKIERLDSDGRIKLLLNLFGRPTPVILEATQTEAI